MRSDILRRFSKPAAFLVISALMLFAGVGIGFTKSLADNPPTDAAAPVIAHFQGTRAEIQPGNKATITVYATGNSLSYQWYLNSTDTITGGKPINEATNKTLTIDAWAPGTTYYYCVVTNMDNSVSGSKSATATSDILQITVPRIDAAAPVFKNFEQHEFTVKPGMRLMITIPVTGDSLSYQWYSNSVNSTTGGKPISGATDESLTIDALAPGTTYYYCVATNTNINVNGNTTATATSDILQITVPRIDAAAPVITNFPQSKNVSFELKPGCKLNFTFHATGDLLSYQWYSNTKDSTNGGKLMDGETSNELTVNYATKPETIYYYCIVTNTNNNANGTRTATATSGILKVIMLVPAQAPTISSPSNTVAASGSTAEFWVKGSSPDGGILSYKWQKSTDGGVTWQDISGAVSRRYTTEKLSRVDNGTKYRCLVTNSRNSTTATVISAAATLRVTARPTLETIWYQLCALLKRWLNI